MIQIAWLYGNAQSKRHAMEKARDLLKDSDSEQALTFSAGQVMTIYCRIKLCLQETATHRAASVHNKSTLLHLTIYSYLREIFPRASEENNGFLFP